MACPTCDHTMQKIADEPAMFWCPRCGTIFDRADQIERDDLDLGIPMLVGRVECLLDETEVEFRRGLHEAVGRKREW